MNTITLESKFDSLNIAVAYSQSKTPVKAIFQIVHGMAEHKERYYPLMEYLSKRGYICVIHDHRGHGDSVKCSEDLGYMYTGGAAALVEDVKLVHDWAKAEFPNLPVYLFGHSMGSMVVRAFTKKYDSDIEKLVVCGCPSDNPAKGAGLALASIIGIFKGQHHRSKLLQGIAFGSYAAEFKDEGTSLAWLSANKENTLAYYKDPLCGFIFTINGFKNLFRVMGMCYGVKDWAMQNPELKIKFISGANDPCRINDKAFYKAIDFLKERGYKKIESTLYPGLRHEILLEGETKVWEELYEFLES